MIYKLLLGNRGQRKQTFFLSHAIPSFNRQFHDRLIYCHFMCLNVILYQNRAQKYTNFQKTGVQNLTMVFKI